jgi:6-phosphogluconolactonase
MAESPAPSHRFFVGTYTKGSSRGIYTATLDASSGAISAPELAAEAPNPTFIALSPDRAHLYAVCAGPGWASSFRVDRDSGRLAPVQQVAADKSPTPCHIAVNRAGTVALAANYHLGLAAAIPLAADGTMGVPRVVAHSGRGPHPTRQTQPHVHSTNFSPDGRFALVCDLGLDRVFTYAVDPEAVALRPAARPFVESLPGAGPRHLAFSRDGARDGHRAYVINELDNTIAVHRYDAASGGLSPLQTVSVLPAGYAGDATAAEVCVHPAGLFVYGSSRGPDTLAVFAADPVKGTLAPVESVRCGGKGPRGFAISPDGQWLVCAHQDSNTLCSFRIDPGSGRLTRIPGTVSVSMPVCVLFAG